MGPAVDVLRASPAAPKSPCKSTFSTPADEKKSHSCPQRFTFCWIWPKLEPALPGQTHATECTQEYRRYFFMQMTHHESSIPSLSSLFSLLLT